MHDYQPSKIDIKVGFEKANEKDKPMKCSAIEGQSIREVEIITAIKLDVYSLLGQPVLDNLEIPVGPI